jgi:protein-tyrosine phosphatase
MSFHGKLGTHRMNISTDMRSSLVNLRDVGGQRTDDGGVVAHGVLYRSEAPQAGDAEPTDITPWPARTVVDLRSAGEIHQPHPLGAQGARVHNLVLNPALAPGARNHAAATAGGLGSLYVHLLTEASARIARIAEIVAEADGPVLVHCAAGKDRTGIVVAILLRVVGVSRADVLADYLRTNDRLPELLARLDSAGVVMPHDRSLLQVSPNALNAVLDEVDGTPGGAEGWLRAAGADAATVALLRERLTGK